VSSPTPHTQRGKVKPYEKPGASSRKGKTPAWLEWPLNPRGDGTLQRSAVLQSKPDA